MTQILEIVVAHSVSLGQEGDFRWRLRWGRRAVVFMLPSRDNLGWAQTG